MMLKEGTKLDTYFVVVFLHLFKDCGEKILKRVRLLGGIVLDPGVE